jgi:hypothetical protein
VCLSIYSLDSQHAVFCDEVLGTKDLTDGEWVWPERLEHYITDHDVALPKAFIDTMGRNCWSVPARGDVTLAISCDPRLLHKYKNFNYWRQWAAHRSGPPAVPAKIVVQPTDGREGQSTTNIIRSVLRRLMFGSVQRGE